jgi:acyl dehydratase
MSLAQLDAAIGQELGVSDWITVDQPMIDAFANLTGDHQWVHVDVDRATREMGGTFAHGLLTLSLLPRIIAEVVTITGVRFGLNYGLDKVRFLGRVMAGSLIRGRVSLLSGTPRGDGTLYKFSVVIEVGNNTVPACAAEALTLVYPEA